MWGLALQISGCPAAFAVCDFPAQFAAAAKLRTWLSAYGLLLQSSLFTLAFIHIIYHTMQWP